MEECRFFIGFFQIYKFKTISRRNLSNREMRGPLYNTGRNHFSQLCFEADYKLGNHQSCMAENSSQTKKEITEFADRTPDYDQAANLRDVHISNSKEPTSESLSSPENNNGSKEASNAALSISSTPRDIISAPIGCCSDAHQYDGTRMTTQETKTISHEHAVFAPECYGVILNGKHNEIMLHGVYKNHYPSNSGLRSHGTGNGIREDQLLIRCFKTRTSKPYGVVLLRTDSQRRSKISRCCKLLPSFINAGRVGSCRKF